MPNDSGDSDGGLGQSISRNLTENISRRRSLKLAGISALGLSGIPYVTGDRVDTVTVKERTDFGEWTYMEVPAEWKDHLERARETREELSEQFRNNTNVIATSLTSSASPRDFGGGYNGFDIRVHLKDSTAIDIIPESMDRINIRTLERRENIPADHSGIDTCSDIEDAFCHNVVEPDPVIGGLPLFSEFTSGPDTRTDAGALCAIVEHEFDGMLGLTADHVGYDIANDDTDWYQYCDYVGNTEESNRLTYDSQFFEYDNSRSVDHRIREPNATRTISGYYSETAICTMADGEETVWATGPKSGATPGPLTDCDFTPSSGTAYDASGVRVEATVGRGDSGGPIYRHVPMHHTVGMVGMTTLRGDTDAGTDCMDHQLYTSQNGPAMYEIVENMMNDQISFTW